MITDARSAAADPDAPTPEWGASLGWRAWVLILSISIALGCFKLGDARTLTEHEVWVAGGAKQMALDRDWLFPKIGDHLFLEKPPLPHWLAVISAKILGGFSETTVRLPSVLAGLGVVVVMTLLALRWFGTRAAIFTALLQATTVHFITYARLAEADMLLAFIVILALYVFVRLQSIGGAWPKPHRHLSLLFWALLGLSNMVKGLGFGPLLILTPCAAFLILKRDRAAWRRMISWSGLVLAFVITLAWPIVVLQRAPETQELWRDHLLRRALTGVGHGQPWWYYFTTAPWQLLPWTPALLLAVRPSLLRATRNSDSPDRFIWIWGIVPIALLTLSRGKHHHYIISCLCAFSPLCALGLLRCGIRAAVACVVIACAGILFVHARILPARDRSRSDREFLQAVRSLIPPDAPLAATGGPEIARHIFYVEPPPAGVQNPVDLANRYAHVPAFFVIARRSAEPQLTKLGQIGVVAQSRQTRNEKSPADRFTLFRIETGAFSHP